MKKFNVGDIVKANVDHPKFPRYYDVTNEYALCRVVGCYGIDSIEIEVIYHTKNDTHRKIYSKKNLIRLVINIL